MKKDHNSAKAVEDLLIEELRKRKPEAFKKLFKEYGDDLLIFTFTVLNNRLLTQVAMRKLFIRLMSKGKSETITYPLYPFLLKEMKEICIQVSFSPVT